MDYEAIVKEIIQIVRDQQGYESAAFLPMVAYLKAHFPDQPEAPQDVRELAEWISEMAAAEIERFVQAHLVAAPKTVPMAMLHEIHGVAICQSKYNEPVMREIAARYGYTATESL